ncbi:hypothetical protein [Streptomyces sp. NRRL S-1868]|uniref:hypothetical protein n=1 Tax=Streptomyces sp. NRRL S-1868 TaxID=1463892 RepID=UPI000A5FE156|nr:hypothetical protein [Streptomyces sp. NRRL S-1868]
MALTVLVRCPFCRREHTYTAPVYPCGCGVPLTLPVQDSAAPARIHHRTWAGSWVPVRCASCGAVQEWPQPELGCPCGTLLRVPVARTDSGEARATPEHGTPTDPDALPGLHTDHPRPTGNAPADPLDPDPVTAGPVDADPDTAGPSAEPRTARPTEDEPDAARRPGGGQESQNAQGAGSGRGSQNAQEPQDASEPRSGQESRGAQGPGHEPQDAQGPRAGQEPRSGQESGSGQRSQGMRGSGRRSGPGPAAAPTPIPRPAFEPVTIRTAQDAKTAAAQYLRWLGFTGIQVTARIPASGIDLRGPGVVAHVDPSTAPTALREIETLWLNGLNDSAVPVCFSLAGYTREARYRAEELSLALFVLDLTGTPCPVNTPADHLIRAPR